MSSTKSIKDGVYLRNKSWKPEFVLSVNMGWWILIFYYLVKFTNIRQPMLKLKTHSASMNYFNSDMFKSTNTVVYFDWKTVIYIYVCGQCRTQFMLPNSSRR